MGSEQVPNVLHQQCPICEESFINIGLFIRHCRQKHSYSPEEIPVNDGLEQAGTNTEHWSTYNVCPECGVDSKRRETLFSTLVPLSNIPAVAQQGGHSTYQTTYT
jgi:rubredoxin